MEYRKIGDNYYVRMDRGDEIISTLLEICEKESIPSAVFSGIGGCQSAELQVFIPETGSFETEHLEGMLELVSLNGNVVRDDNGQPYHHTHALFSFKKQDQHGMAGVARTGISPEPTSIAVTTSVTVNLLVYFSPISIISY